MSTDNHVSIKTTVNGVEKSLVSHPMARLLDVIREDMDLPGTKEGCGEGECGACAVQIDGVLVNSCLVPFMQVADKNVVTIEGHGDRGATAENSPAFEELSPLQRAFIEFNGAQCGICTPGMILAAESLIEQNPDPTLDEVKTGLAGNLCRCTGYMKIYDAVLAAAKEMRQSNS